MSLLEGYREWLVFPTEKNPSPNRLFLEKGFLEGKRSGSRHFIAALIDTQAFHNFVISRVHDPDGDDLDIILFDEAVKAKIHQPKKNRFRHRRSSQCTCQQANDSQSKTIVALMPGILRHNTRVILLLCIVCNFSLPAITFVLQIRLD